MTRQSWKYGSFNTQPPKGDWAISTKYLTPVRVSTHSRLKATGCSPRLFRHCTTRFNTQPPKGDWAAGALYLLANSGFNTQPPKGDWDTECASSLPIGAFQHTAA